MSKYKYCQSLEKYVRYPSRKVDIGNIPLGENFPIRIQSMTTTNTLDVNATVNQAKKIFDVGGDYVRITAPSIKEARILKDIKRKLVRDGYNKPLIADIHFTPNAAIEAANIVEKIRINPGNYVDRKSFKVFEIDRYICWGTPKDYEDYENTLKYWQSFYKIENLRLHMYKFMYTEFS